MGNTDPAAEVIIPDQRGILKKNKKTGTRVKSRSCFLEVEILEAILRSKNQKLKFKLLRRYTQYKGLDFFGFLYFL